MWTWNLTFFWFRRAVHGKRYIQGRTQAPAQMLDYTNCVLKVLLELAVCICARSHACEIIFLPPSGRYGVAGISYLDFSIPRFVLLISYSFSPSVLLLWDTPLGVLVYMA